MTPPEVPVGKDGFGFVFDNRAFGPPEHMEIRDWQNECLSAFISKLKDFPPVAFGTQMKFLVAAGVGSGKTITSAMIASHLLNEQAVRRVVYVCPNRAIKKNVRRVFKAFNIHLVDWNNKKYIEGEPITFQGAILTYQSLASKPELQRALARTRTLVIFDEIHHLGDNQAWDQAAREAFQDAAAFVLGLSGTPYRSDNREIPFVEYLEVVGKDGIRKFKSDYAYRLGRAIADGICRKPFFEWMDAEVLIPRAGGGFSTSTFDSELSEESTNMRLLGCVRPSPTNVARRNAIQKTIAMCREENRKLIIFVGGDTSSVEAGGVADANGHLPAELIEFGVDPSHIVSVTSNDADAIHKIEAFGKSDAWILITVNMVSEGVDIPELSAALFLTSITAKSTTVQRIGRALRGDGTALIVMFKDPRYLEFASEIENEWTHEVDTKRRKEAAERDGDREWTPPKKREPEGIDAWSDGFTVNSIYLDESDRRTAIRALQAQGLPRTTDNITLISKLIKSGAYQPDLEPEAAL